MTEHLVELHRKEGEEREPNDYYATHPSAIPPLLKVLEWENGGKIIRENSCGEGHLSKILEIYGHTVVSSDLIDRGYGITGVDFLKPNWLDNMRYDAIIMNPPYKLSLEFIKKSLNLAPVVCAFLKISFLESSSRQTFFRKHPPKYVAVFTKRCPSSKSGVFKPKESSTVCYAWFIWKRGYKEEPKILWI